jgi:hypothetical protein
MVLLFCKDNRLHFFMPLKLKWFLMKKINTGAKLKSWVHSKDDIGHTSMLFKR